MEPADLPTFERAPLDEVAWLHVWQRLGTLSQLLAGWNGGSAPALDTHTMQFAARELAGLARAGFAAPVINPSADGAIYAHWHARGLDIEIVFEAPCHVLVSIEDARGEIPVFEGEDTQLQKTMEALELFANR